MEGNNTAAGIPGLGFNPYTYGYQNQTAFNDYMDPDSLGTMNGPMSMNGSLFGGMGGMTGMPYAPYGGGMQNWYQNMENYQSFMVDSQQRQQQRVREADIRLNSPEEGVKKQAALLQDKIMRNEQEQIQEALNSYVASVKELYPQAKDEDVFNRAGTLFQNMYGKTIPESLREHGSSSLVQGIKQSAGFGVFADKITAEENVSNITGQPVGRWEKAKKTIGNVTGGAAVGGLAFIAARYIIPGLKFLCKSKPFLGRLIGGTVAAGAAIAGGSSK